MTSIDENGLRLTSALRYREVGDDGVLVHLENGRVIVVNPVGLFLVQMLDKQATRKEMIQAIADEYAIAADQAEADVDVFLLELDAEDITRHA